MGRMVISYPFRKKRGGLPHITFLQNSYKIGKKQKPGLDFDAGQVPLDPAWPGAPIQTHEYILCRLDQPVKERRFRAGWRSPVLAGSPPPPGWSPLQEKVLSVKFGKLYEAYRLVSSPEALN
jgi:hypothetical protein